MPDVPVERLVVEGGHPIEGRVLLSGAKNAALPVLAASLLVDGVVDLFNVPTKMSDIQGMLTLLSALGAEVSVEEDHVRIDPRSAEHSELPQDLAARTRASVLLMGPLLHRFGEATIPAPGGCSIGTRPIDLHCMAVERFGGAVVQRDDAVHATIRSPIPPAEITFPIRTTGGTENALSLAARAEGQSLLLNAHVRPEITDLCRFLNAAGARIRPIGSGAIGIHGVPRLHAVTHRIVPGDDEALTFLTAAAVTNGELEIVGARADQLEIPLAYFRGSGVRILDDAHSLYVLPSQRLTGMDVGTGPYPGINSDMQPFFVVFCTQALGPSRVTDTRFGSRFRYVEQLNRLGSGVRVEGSTAIVPGQTGLRGACVEAVDLRAGGALAVAGLAATGETHILNVAQIDRGYEELERKLQQIGARIERIRERP